MHSKQEKDDERESSKRKKSGKDGRKGRKFKKFSLKKKNPHKFILKKKKHTQLTQSCFCKTVQPVFITAKQKPNNNKTYP